jgi:hypothetical protein
VEELRALLDGAVQHLWQTWTILYEVSEEGQRDVPRPQWSDRRLRQLGDELTTELDSVVEDGLRIKLRTPPDSPVDAAHEKALEFVLKCELDPQKVPRERADGSGEAAATADHGVLRGDRSLHGRDSSIRRRRRTGSASAAWSLTSRVARS